MFGTAQQQTGGGLFGQSQQNIGGGLFGQSAQQPQPSGGLFGNLGGQNAQQTQTQQFSGGLFGSLGQNNQQNQQNQQTSGGLFGGIGQNNQQAQQNQQQGGGLFGQSTQQPQQQQGGLFNNSLQQPLGQSTQTQSQPALGQSTAMWQPNNSVGPREKNVPEQIKTVVDKWDVNSPNCVFKHYFYNRVGENQAHQFGPAQHEDEKAWEEALSNKPGPGYVPALCTGFSQLGERISVQQRSLASYNTGLHEINRSLTTMLQIHETKTSIRAMDAKRKHIVLRQRCLTLATKVQVLKSRGYSLSSDEENLKAKLQALEKGVTDPGLGARAEEIWARMLTVQERARLLKSEIEKSNVDSPDMLDEETTRAAKQILEDYDRQLLHLKKELDSIQKSYEKWEQDQAAPGNFNGR